MKDFEYYEKKADSSEKLISDLEKFEIFNLECAEKYDSSQNIDFIIDEEGCLKFLVVGVSSNKLSFFGGSRECVTKIGANVIVISAEEGKIKRAKA